MSPIWEDYCLLWIIPFASGRYFCNVRKWIAVPKFCLIPRSKQKDRNSDLCVCLAYHLNCCSCPLGHAHQKMRIHATEKNDSRKRKYTFYGMCRLPSESRGTQGSAEPRRVSGRSTALRARAEDTWIEPHLAWKFWRRTSNALDVGSLVIR